MIASRIDQARILRLPEYALQFEMRMPNALTAETLRKIERGEDVHHAKDMNDLFAQLGIERTGAVVLPAPSSFLSDRPLNVIANDAGMFDADALSER